MGRGHVEVIRALLRSVDGPAAEEPRYRMLETIRELGRERLGASGEAATARFRAIRRHYAEGRGWLERVLGRGTGTSTAACMKLLA